LLLSRGALAQPGYSPFATPPATPGINWPSEALKKLKSAESELEHEQRRGDMKGYGRALAEIGAVHSMVQDWGVAVVYYKQAYAISSRVGDVEGEAVDLANMGNAQNKLGKTDEAVATLTRGLTLVQGWLAGREGDKRIRHLQASFLLDLGDVYRAQQKYDKALELFNQAQAIAEQDRNVATQEHVAIELGILYGQRNDYQKAFEMLKKAVELSEQNHDKVSQASALLNLGNNYLFVGEYREALQYLEQALPLKRELHDRLGEGAALADIGFCNQLLGNSKQALDLLKQALAIFQDLGEKQDQATALLDIGRVTAELGERDQGLAYLNLALPLTREVHDRMGEAAALGFTGLTYAEKGDRKRALEYYNKTFPILSSLQNDLGLAHLYYALLLLYRDDQPALAVFYGKQAIAHLERVRETNTGLSTDAQASFLASKGLEEHPIEDYYHSLADLLIRQGRLPEAQQVLDLLKQQEYSDFTRGAKPVSRPLAATAAPAPEAPSMTASETRAQQDLQKSSVSLVALGAQWDALSKITSRTPEQERQFQQASAGLTRASQVMNAFFVHFYDLFGKDSAANREVADVKGDATRLKRQIAQMPHTVALYTLVTHERYCVIVITGTTMFARESAIGEDQLNAKIDAFTRVLRDPHSDPIPLAAELYKILVGPVADDLSQAQATNLVWFLDGKLRYLPMSALYDGRQYLVQRFNSVNILPVSIDTLAEKPDMRKVSVAAMGISRQFDPTLSALPGVVQELRSIVKDPRDAKTDGVLPGALLLDSEFTERAMQNELALKPSVVHIASHFVFMPGDDSKSYLLLAGEEKAGNGYHLSVADFRDNAQLTLENTALITLSACETGIGGVSSDGREVDGMATTAQLKGARSVIASLWGVSDASTGELMADFYRRWAAGAGTVSKVEALRQGQLDLLEGKVKPKNPSTSSGSASYAHPYYWAPFVLTGNWL
jgi:CHAT domain-containing protein/tetratricopeptide (TPR) repeat protein